MNPGAGETRFQLTRHIPSPDLSYVVLRYWIVRWDLRGQEPYCQEILPHPCVNLVIEQDEARIFGVMRRKSSHLLAGRGRVFGIKFRPGAFYPFVKAPVSLLTDASLSLQEVFGADGNALEEAIRSQEDNGALIAVAEAFLRRRLPERDEHIEAINRIVDGIIADRAITRVDDLVSRFHLSKRTLQRLFSQYVGVSPKWVIKRYRLHEAADRLAAGKRIDWAQLAVELGYFDQAHFIKDFKSLVGQSPAVYARSLGS